MRLFTRPPAGGAAQQVTGDGERPARRRAHCPDARPPFEGSRRTLRRPPPPPRPGRPRPARADAYTAPVVLLVPVGEPVIVHSETESHHPQSLGSVPALRDGAAGYASDLGSERAGLDRAEPGRLRREPRLRQHARVLRAPARCRTSLRTRPRLRRGPQHPAARGRRRAASWRSTRANGSSPPPSESRDGLRFVLGDGAILPFADATFDFVTGFMSLMDVADPEATLLEVAWCQVRRLRGVLDLASRDEHAVAELGARRRRPARGTGDRQLLLPGPGHRSLDLRLATRGAPSAAPTVHDHVRAPNTHRLVRRVRRCRPRHRRAARPGREGEETARDHPGVADSRIVPFFLHIRARRAG